MIRNILGQSSFWVVNKAIARHLGCNDSALLLSELIDKSYYHQDKGTDVNGFFYYTSDAIEESLNISYHNQKKCISNLVEAGFIETKLMGVPAKLHFKIIENKILNFLKTGFQNFQKQEFEIFENINKEQNIKNKKEKKDVTSTHPTSTDFLDLAFKAKQKKSYEHLQPPTSNHDFEPPNIQTSITPPPPAYKPVGGIPNRALKSTESVASAIRKGLKSIGEDFDAIMEKTTVPFPKLVEEFLDYWVYNKKREINLKEYKGMASSFVKWIDIAYDKELPTKEISSGVNSSSEYELAIKRIERMKPGITMSKSDSAQILKFISENNINHDVLRHSVKVFCDGVSMDYKIWLKIIRETHERFLKHGVIY